MCRRYDFVRPRFRCRQIAKCNHFDAPDVVECGIDDETMLGKADGHGDEQRLRYGFEDREHVAKESFLVNLDAE